MMDRANLMHKIIDAEDFNHDNEVILAVEVEQFINDIERRINYIIDDLREIKGLSEVDSIRETLSELASDLY